MRVRRADLRDAPALVTLYRALVGPSQELGEVGPVLDHPGTSIWVAEDTSLCAMASLHVLPNVTQGGRPYALVENVVTEPSRRGKGYGRAVLEAVIAEAWAQNAYKVMLLTGQSAQARGFYERLGFSADEKWGMSLRRVPLRHPSR